MATKKQTETDTTAETVNAEIVNEVETGLVQLVMKPKAAVIEGNFDEVSEYIDRELEKYDGHLVTKDTLDDDKKLSQEIKKSGKDIDALRIKHKKALSKPITEFEANMKKLSDKYNACALKISGQVAKFEQETKDECLKLLTEFCNSEYDKLEIREEFRTASVDAYALLGSLTKSGALTKGAKDKVLGEVNKCLMQQTKIDGRLASLENVCLKAGMTEPLGKHHVESFLYVDSDEVFNESLNKIINAEVERLQKIQDAANQKAQEQAQFQQNQQNFQPQNREFGNETPNFDAQSAIDQSYVSAQEYDHQQAGTVDNRVGIIAGGDAFANHLTEFQPQSQQIQQQIQSTPRYNAEGKIIKMTTVQFEIAVPDHISDEQVSAKIKSKLVDAGFTTLKSIETHNA